MQVYQLIPPQSPLSNINRFIELYNSCKVQRIPSTPFSVGLIYQLLVQRVFDLICVPLPEPPRNTERRDIPTVKVYRYYLCRG